MAEISSISSQIQQLDSSYTLWTNQQRIADRSLTSGQRDAISVAIRSHAGQKIEVVMVPTAEAKVFGDQLIELLKGSGWDVNLVDPDFLSPFPAGLLLRISSEPNSAVQTLISALEKAGIKLILIRPASLSPDYVQLIVGAKPPA